MKKRNLDITEQTINCFGDLEVDLDEGFIEAAYELWFDVDRYFGTDTRDKDDTWINFYTRWHPDRTITAIYFVESDETVKEHTWELTPQEQEFFRKKMEDYAKTQGNQTLQEIWEETKDYIELPTTHNPNKKICQQDPEELKDKIDSQGYITGIVYVPLEELINSSRDRFLELLSIGLTDTTRLRYISYELVGAETTKSEIGLRKISKEMLMEEKNLEITLRITEIQAILENNLYEDKKEEQELVTELEQLEKERLVAE